MLPITPKPQNRYQITFPKDSSIAKRINSLLQKFDGMDIVEITKLALIKLDDANQLSNTREPDEFEKKVIEDFLANPQLLGVEDSNKFIGDLASKSEVIAMEKKLGIKLDY